MLKGRKKDQHMDVGAGAHLGSKMKPEARS